MAAVPRARLLVFGPPPTVPPHDLAEAARAVPIRFTGVPASSAELVRRLGEEADVVLFWERTTAFDTNYLARAALASGVPSVASPLDNHIQLEGAVLRPDHLTVGLTDVFTSRSHLAELAKAAQAFCREDSWSRVAALHSALWALFDHQCGSGRSH